MHEIFNQYKNWLITEAELHAELNELGIRGMVEISREDQGLFDKIKYKGYDYKNQNWLRIN